MAYRGLKDLKRKAAAEKHLILLKILNMTHGLVSKFYNFFDKKTSLVLLLKKKLCKMNN